MFVTARVVIDTGVAHDMYRVVADAKDLDEFINICEKELLKSSDDMVESIIGFRSLKSGDFLSAKI